MNNAPKANVSINLNTMPTETCGAELKDQPFKQGQTCDGTEFTKVFTFKRLSALTSPTGREEIVQLETIKCLKCGAMKVIK